jgi:hypothetical protein
MFTIARAVVPTIKRKTPRDFEAPSAWHAAAWLLEVTTLAAHFASSDASTGLVAPIDVRYGTPMFRGQNRPTRDLVPSIYRAKARQSENVRAVALLMTALGKIMSYGEASAWNTQYANLAAMQHYGVPTQLLDFSLDPRIAVYFACKDARQGRKAVVYFTQFTQITSTGAAVVLPPPWVERLYRQKGLFALLNDERTIRALRPACLTMTFPVDQEYVQMFDWVGTDADEPWYQKAFQWARRRIDAGAVPESLVKGGVLSDADIWRNIDAEIPRLEAECGPPPFRWTPLMPAEMAPDIDNFTSMLEWFALKAMNGVMHYDANLIEALIPHNEKLLRQRAVVYRYLRNTMELQAATLRQSPMVAALEAVAACMDEWDARRARGQ